VKLGKQYADRVVVGSNARCIALLNALKQVSGEVLQCIWVMFILLLKAKDYSDNLKTVRQ
jgi:hypothetical protein